MSKIRVYQIAKELNVSSKDVIEKLESLKLDVHNHMSTLEDNQVEQLKKAFKSETKEKNVEATPAKPETSDEKPKAKKKTSWTVGTPKVNRPKRKSDFQKNRPQSKPPVSTHAKPVQDQQQTKPQEKKAEVKHTPVKTQEPVDKKVESQKPVVKKEEPRDKPQTASKPADTRKPRTQHSKKVEDTPIITPENAPNAEKETRKVPAKKKKKKEVKKPFNKDATLEEKFSKKVKNKKKKKVEKVNDNSQYFNEEGVLLVPEQLTVGKFAEMLGQSPSEIIMKLMALGIMANLNQTIEYETAELIALEFEVETKKIVPVDETEEIIETYFEEDEEEDLQNRPPVVTVMGHVDHGKTSLLDAIRETAVTDREAGGITQHIGASEAMINGQKIVFLDTPGHEAFTTLRARGAQVTDIAVLVVAADDGVMPQTIEAIDHAKAAGVPIIVAINKIDKPGCNPEQVKSELSEHGLLVEDWGGDVISVEVSALKKLNIEGLLEMILLQSEVLELKANPDRDAIGTIIDAKVEKGRGIVTTLLVQNGTLSIGDSIVCGSSFGRVRAIFNHKGKRVKKAGPSTGVEITGLNEVPVAGDRFMVVEDDKVARSIAEKKQVDERNVTLKNTPQHVTLEDIFDQIQAGKTKEIKIVLKADVQGSLEALKTSLVNISNEEVAVNVIHASVGTVTESDVLLASASDAIIIGFNVRPIQAVENLASQEGVELKTYRIIYEAINDVKDALIGMLDPEYKEEILGKVEVRQVIKVPNVGAIAGCYVLSGKVTRSAEFRLIREGIVIHEGKISSLRRFKDDVKEVAKGYECGIGFENYNDMKEGDIIEAFHMVEIKRKTN